MGDGVVGMLLFERWWKDRLIKGNYILGCLAVGFGWGSNIHIFVWSKYELKPVEIHCSNSMNVNLHVC